MVVNVLSDFFFFFSGFVKLVRHQEEGRAGESGQVQPLKLLLLSTKRFNKFGEISDGCL